MSRMRFTVRYGLAGLCDHCKQSITLFGGIWFGWSATCNNSPDTQHRPQGTPVPERPTRKPATLKAAKTRAAHQALAKVAGTLPPALPASVIARAADTGSAYGLRTTPRASGGVA